MFPVHEPNTDHTDEDVPVLVSSPKLPMLAKILVSSSVRLRAHDPEEILQVVGKPKGGIAAGSKASLVT